MACHCAASTGGLARSRARSCWHGASHSTCKCCTSGSMSCRSGMTTELIAAPWTSSRQFSQVLWLQVCSRQLQRACHLGSKKSCHLQPVRSELDFTLQFAVKGGARFPGIVRNWSRGPPPDPWSHCISYAPRASSHCCCCRHRCDKQHMGTSLSSERGPDPYHRS